jgi:hypothetical protein
MPTTWGIHSDGLREKRQQGEGRQSNIVQVQVAVAVNDQVEVEVKVKVKVSRRTRSEQPDQRGGEAEHREEVRRELLVSRSDPAIALQPLKEILDVVPPLVEPLVVAALPAARRIRRDDDATALAP